MKIKICGITNTDDALYAADFGADALGFIFVKSSPRYIAPEKACKIIQALPPFVTAVGVIADLERKEILELIDSSGITCLQFHGNELPEQLDGYPVHVYKSFRVDKKFDLNILSKYKVPAFLLDTYIEGIIGGTGKTFDWEIAAAAKSFGRIILAGGLTPDTIAEEFQKVRPYAIDVNSGVESAPGKKDKEKLKKLFNNVRILESELRRKDSEINK